MALILAVDEDPSFSEFLRAILNGAGHEVLSATNEESALATLKSRAPELILLGADLSGGDGIDLCRRIRNLSAVPIVMLSAVSDTFSVVRSLDAGADDYVAKTAAPEELLARIKARIRPRTFPERSNGHHVFRVGDLCIDQVGHSVTRQNREIFLTPLEFSLLLHLARHPGEVFSRERLLQEIWDYQSPGDADTRLVNVHVQRLRCKIERDPENPEIVLTVRGIGYKVAS